MNDDYLWDKSGEPDPEIQQLEEVLGRLRYQPLPLEIPKDLVVIRRNRYIPYLAIAASLIFALVAGGFWLLRVRRHEPRPATQARIEEPTASPTKTTDRQDNRQVVVDKKDLLVATHPAGKKPSTGIKTIKRPTRLTRREREEALIAKQQLLLALRLASEKLNLAQKKTLSPAAPNQIRNQHKVG